MNNWYLILIMIFSFAGLISCENKQLSYADQICISEAYMVGNFNKDKMWSDGIMKKTGQVLIIHEKGLPEDTRNKGVPLSDKTQDVVRETVFYSTCVDFYENKFKTCTNCQSKEPLVYFRFNVYDFMLNTEGRVADFRKFKEPHYKMKFEFDFPNYGYVRPDE